MHKIDYRTKIDDTHNPKGPDGQGWNRMAIIGIRAHDRCILRPRTWQGAIDTLRGMARNGVPTAYLDCISDMLSCEHCTVVTHKKDPWSASWHIREDSAGHVWLLGDIGLGFAGHGHCFETWAALMKEIDVPMLKRMKDGQGFYWVAERGQSL